MNHGKNVPGPEARTGVACLRIHECYWDWNLVGERERGRRELGQKSKMGLTGLKARCQQEHVPSRGPRGGAISLPFSAAGGCLIS